MSDQKLSVCDAVRFRNKVGMDVMTEVLRTYLRRKDRNIARLTEYAGDDVHWETDERVSECNGVMTMGV